jgi:hypothetical protein
MKLNRLVASLIACHVLMALGAIVAEAAALENVGLAIGQKAPAFTLKDQNDRDVALDSLLKKGPVALVFYRSADW